eukprot:1483758-Prymnesium_polylepis.1
MTAGSTEAAQSLFQQYRRRTSAQEGGDNYDLIQEGDEEETKEKRMTLRSTMGAADNKRMTKDGLRKLLPEVDDALFGTLWGVFDSTGTGDVTADEFVMAIAMLTGACDNVDDQ